MKAKREPSNKLNLIGQKFGKLTVVSETDKRRGSHVIYECLCDCGNTCYVPSDFLRRKRNPKSHCGCSHKGRGENKFYIHGETVVMEDNKGHRCKISIQDLSRVKQFYWNAQGDYWYTCYPTKIALHRFITECPDSMVVDHVNHDPSDNRRVNLRICTYSQNNQNRTPYGRSLPKGVSKAGDRYRAYIMYNGNKLQQSFETLEQAISKRKEWELRYHKEYKYREK